MRAQRAAVHEDPEDGFEAFDPPASGRDGGHEPVFGSPDLSDDPLRPARGVMLGCAVGAMLWIPIAAGLWMLFG
jgi:hypothetical protein